MNVTGDEDIRNFPNHEAVYWFGRKRGFSAPLGG